jgi:L-iditol 2-dehydrogenase
VRSQHCLGHEGSGEIVWTGSEVSHLKIGDRVAIEPGVPCGKCFECSAAHYNLCLDVKFSGVPPHTGSMRRYHVHPADYLHKMPDNLTYADGALLEPLSVALRGFERGPLKLGEAGVVFGAGPIGLISLAVAKAAGACPLVITDLDRGRLDFAERFVPGAVGVQVDLTKSPQEMAMAVREVVREKGGDVPRVVFECTGVQSSVITASFVPRPAGEVIVIGVGKAIMNELPFMHLSMAEVSRAIVRDVQDESLTASSPGRSEVHQPVPSLVAFGDAVALSWSARPKAFGHASISSRESGSGAAGFG